MDRTFFDRNLDRHGTGAYKWEAHKVPGPYHTTVPEEDVVPMWIADMDFATAPSIVERLLARVQHPAYGYTLPSAEYYQAICDWHKTRYGNDAVKRRHILNHTSVLAGVGAAVEAFTLPGENILINQTTYTGFQSTVKNLGRNLVYSPLVKDEKGLWRMNFEEMEKLISANKISLMIFCSPHNPTGRVWEKWEIENVVNLCAKHGVKIVSDEIWADFVVDPECKHIPTQSVSDVAKEIVTANYAPSKTFNLAGLQGSYSVTYNKQMRDKLDKIGSTTHSNAVSLLTLEACIGAYTGGAEYIDEMLKYVRENQKLMVDFFNSCEGIEASLPQGTYVLWVNFEGTGMDVGVVRDKLREVGVITTDGRGYHGKTYLRFNCACPKANCEKAIKAMKKVFTLK